MNENRGGESTNWNDFIIDGDKFVRDWDGLYNNFKDPWNQEELAQQDIAHDLSLQLLKSVRRLEQGGGVSRILDVGCATGYHSQDYRKLFPEANYFGIDVSKGAIRNARKKYGGEKVQFMEEDILSPSEKLNALADGFDVVTASRTIYYLGPEIEDAVGRIRNLLREDGLFLWTYNYRPDSFTNRFLSPDSFSALLDTFALELVAMIEYRTPSDNETVDIRIHRKHQG